MIQFPCTGCGRLFSVPDDEAGRSVQCSECGRLADVPTRSDLSSLADDGTFKLTEPAARADPSQRVAEIARAFHGDKVDADGEPIDLRNTPEDLAGLDPDAAQPGEPQRYKPQYDPETGELVRPLDLRPSDHDIDPDSIPLAAPAPVNQTGVIDYARLGDPELSRPALFPRLLEPANLAVMAFVLLGLAIGYIVQLIAHSLVSSISQQTLTFSVAVWPLNVMFWLALSHFGNTIVATGPEEHDELPRPLLSLGLWDDIFGPMLKVLAAVLICYAPMFAVLAAVNGSGRKLALPLMLAGGFYFPAVLLTVMTSGSILNLHPDRIRKVMGVGGTRYLLLALGWTVAFPVYLWATLHVNLLYSALGIETGTYQARDMLLAAPLAALSVFFLHYFCWQLGLLFRAGHERFGWVWEELLRQREQDRKQRGLMSADDRDAMRRARQQRAAAALARPKTPREARERLGGR